MITLLIIDYDLNYAKNIISNIVTNNERIRLLDIATSTKEALHIISNFKPHFAIINTDVVDMEKINELDYKCKSILVTANHEKWVKGNYVLKSNDFTVLKDRVSELLEKNDFAQLKEQVIKYFWKLKFNISTKGSMYLMDCILYCYKHRNTYSFDSLRSTLYPLIAQKYNTTAHLVSSNIKLAVNEMYDRNYIENSLDYIEEFFYFSKNMKPTAKVIISTFMSKLEY